MRIELDGNVIVLRAPTNSSTIVTQIPGSRYEKARGAWVLPLSWMSCVAARGIIGPSLEVGPKLAEWYKEERDRRVAPALALREAKELPDGWGPFFDRVEAES